jgi:hypothetical protein
MCFDGSYRRQVRDRGVVHRVTIRCVRCPSCRTRHAVLPGFVLAARLDSADTIGTALAAAAGADGAESVAHLLSTVPDRTVRSWKARFAERAPLLAVGLESFAAHWGGPVLPANRDPVVNAATALGATWWTSVNRHFSRPVLPPWRFASWITGGELLSTRVDLPWSGGHVPPIPARGP